MKTILASLILSLPLLAQDAPPVLPSASATLVKQFEGFQEKTLADAERSIAAAREKLVSLLNEESRKASQQGREAEAVSIRAYVAQLQRDSREAEAPSSFDYWNTDRLVVGYYNNNKTAVVKVETVAKKRTLVVHGNQQTASTIGEIFLVRGNQESKVGEWKKGQANPLSFDVSGQVTKPGEYTIKFRYKDGGDEFTAEKVGIQVAKD